VIALCSFFACEVKKKNAHDTEQDTGYSMDDQQAVSMIVL
jgi:hypothetical protein